MQRDPNLAFFRQARCAPVDREHALEEPQRELGALARRVEHGIEPVAPSLRLERLHGGRGDPLRADLQEALLEKRRKLVVEPAVTGEVGEEHCPQRALGSRHGREAWHRRKRRRAR